MAIAAAATGFNAVRGDSGFCARVIGTSLLLGAFITGCNCTRDVDRHFHGRHEAVRWIHSAPCRLVYGFIAFSFAPIPIPIVTNTLITDPRLCTDGKVVFEERLDFSGLALLGIQSTTTVLDAQTGRSRISFADCTEAEQRVVSFWPLQLREPVGIGDEMALSTSGEYYGAKVLLHLNVGPQEKRTFELFTSYYTPRSAFWYPHEKLLLLLFGIESNRPGSPAKGGYLACVDVSRLEALADSDPAPEAVGFIP